jgi:amyloid beta A4 protein
MRLLFVIGLASLTMAEPSGRTEPMVAMLCPETSTQQQSADAYNGQQMFHNKFLSNGKWKTDTDLKATCKKDKVEILEYCKKVYPDRDITNIVEASHVTKIGNWCKLGKKKCQSQAMWVKPFR